MSEQPSEKSGTFMTDDELADMIHKCEIDRDFKKAAIYAFVLARRAQHVDDKAAGIWGRTCFELLDKCPSDTLEDCAQTNVKIEGIFIPGLFHEGTVRRELAGLNL